MSDIPETGFDDRPVQVADGIWWVGHYVPGDPFQCHVYLIDAGDDSVLIDPGSLVTWEHTRKKIEQVMPLERIRWFVCHHQDPDVAGAMHRIDPLVTRKDARIVTHWRAEMLLRHMALAMPMWLVDQNEWRLELPDRTLRFVFTPYMHFPGAFCTFDERTGMLFSSDIFGGFTEPWSLWAKDESYFEAMRPFHEHYMPSNEVLVHGLQRIEKLSVKAIAPQHGSIIPERLVPFMIEKLKGLECGLYLMSVTDSDIQRLMRINAMLREALRSMIIYRDLAETAAALTQVVAEVLPVDGLEFYVREPDGTTLHLEPEHRYIARPAAPPPCWAALVKSGRADAVVHVPRCGDRACQRHTQQCVVLSLPRQDEASPACCAVLRLTEPSPVTHEVEQVLSRLAIPLAVAIDRDAMMRRLEEERARAHEASIRDPMTGLFNRHHMQATMRRVMALRDQPERGGLGAVIFDIDHFKNVNDTYGHLAGDDVLRSVAKVIQRQCRASDIPVRIGGEEFALFLVGGAEAAADVAERVRQAVEAMTYDGDLAAHRTTLSAGVALLAAGESFEDLLGRADEALYRAKRGGRNRVEVAPHPAQLLTIRPLDLASR